MPGAVDRKQARHAEQRIGAERERIEVGVVEPPVDDVDALPAGGGAHVEVAVAHEQVRALDQFHAHLLREEGMLEIGAVVRAGRQHHHRRLARRARRDRAQRVEQQRGVVLDRQHRLPGEQLREQPHHHLAVLEHVGHAGGRAQVVLQHQVAAVAVADQVDARDVRIHLVRQVQADHRHLVGLVGQHLLGRNHAGLENFLTVVDVVQEPVERVDALLQAPLEHVPLGSRDDARNGVERDQALGALLVAIDGEGDADAVKQQVGFAALLRDPLRRHGGEPLGQRRVMLAHRAVGQVHLVELSIRHGSGLRHELG